MTIEEINTTMKTLCSGRLCDLDESYDRSSCRLGEICPRFESALSNAYEAIDKAKGVLEGAQKYYGEKLRYPNRYELSNECVRDYTISVLSAIDNAVRILKGL